MSFIAIVTDVPSAHPQLHSYVWLHSSKPASKKLILLRLAFISSTSLEHRTEVQLVELARNCAVSVHQVRKTIADLCAEGYLIRRGVSAYAVNAARLMGSQAQGDAK